MSDSETAASAESELRTVDYARKHWIPQPNGQPLHITTVSRWYRYGINGVKLRIQKVGRAPMLRKEWIDTFFKDLTEAEQSASPMHDMSTQPTAEDFAEVGL